MTISGIPIPSFRVLVNSLMSKSINDLLWFNNKNEMYFFREFINQNKCIIPNQINEILLEFDMIKCKF